MSRSTNLHDRVVAATSAVRQSVVERHAQLLSQPGGDYHRVVNFYSEVPGRRTLPWKGKELSLVEFQAVCAHQRRKI